MEVKTIQEVCCNERCHVVFWISTEHHERLVSEKTSFYCPNGHPQSYQGETDSKRAQRHLEEKIALRREKDAEIERLNKLLRAKCKKPRKAKK